MSIQIRVAGLVAYLAVVSAAHAQTVVEWKVSEGGNGHWYQLCAQSQCFEVLGHLAATNGAHLATLNSLAEASFCGNLIRAKGVSVTYVGGSRAPNSDVERGWTWVTGEPFVAGTVPWMAGNPGCCAENEFWLCLSNDCRLGDVQECSAVVGGGGLWEWDADCNGDGVVDYGQISRGELADLNANNVPDICELSVSGVVPVSGPSTGGTTVTINGTGFTLNPVVKFGGTQSANVTRESLTRITATIPPHLPGNVAVSVDTWTSPDAFYYRPECGSDLDQNGTVDAGDISIILLDFGPCYEPPAALAAPAPTPLLADEPAQKPTQR